jgi:hypothetical protein
MQPISIAEVRRRLPIGTKIKVDYPRTVIHGNCGQVVHEGSTQFRKVVKQTHYEMISSNEDKKVHCSWSGTKAKADENSIYLFHESNDEWYAKFTKQS